MEEEAGNSKRRQQVRDATRPAASKTRRGHGREAEPSLGAGTGKETDSSRAPGGNSPAQDSSPGRLTGLPATSARSKCVLFKALASFEQP